MLWYLWSFALREAAAQCFPPPSHSTTPPPPLHPTPPPPLPKSSQPLLSFSLFTPGPNTFSIILRALAYLTQCRNIQAMVRRRYILFCSSRSGFRLPINSTILRSYRRATPNRLSPAAAARLSPARLSPTAARLSPTAAARLSPTAAARLSPTAAGLPASASRLPAPTAAVCPTARLSPSAAVPAVPALPACCVQCPGPVCLPALPRPRADTGDADHPVHRRTRQDNHQNDHDDCTCRLRLRAPAPRPLRRASPPADYGDRGGEEKRWSWQGSGGRGSDWCRCGRAPPQGPCGRGSQALVEQRGGTQGCLACLIWATPPCPSPWRDVGE